MNINRLRLVTLGILAVGAMLLCANRLQADQVIYSQPLQTPLVDVGGFYAFGYRTADTFTLTQGASLDSLQWWGSYENDNAAGYPTATATGFLVTLGSCLASDCLAYEDAIYVSGFPMTFSPSMAHETFLGTSTTVNVGGEIPSTSSNYSYEVNFPVPVQLSSGEYFLSIFPLLPTDDPGWSFDAGTGGDGISQGLNPTLQDKFDLAFTLEGTPTANVPEPSSLLMLAIGLALICLLPRRARRLRLSVPVLVLLAFACLPVTTHADTLTLDGASVDSVSFNTTLKTFSVQMGATDALPYQLDLTLGTKIPVLTLDEFAIVDGTPVEDEIQFLADFVDSWQYTTGSDMLTSDVTFRYGEAKVTEGSGGGIPAPEPSSVALLASGLLGLIGFGRKKDATARGGGHPV